MTSRVLICGLLLQVASCMNVTELITNIPLIFPKNESLFNFSHNSSVLETLSKHLKNDTEVEDLLKMRTEAPQPNPPILDVMTTSHLQQHAEEFRDIKQDTELIQSGDDYEGPSVTISQEHSASIVQGQLAAILAGIFVLVAVIGYVGLLSWRRFLENRYGNREMLVNEEELNDPSDLRHFSL